MLARLSRSSFVPVVRVSWLAGLAGLAAPAAHALGFDDEAGKVTLAGATFALGFEDSAAVEAIGVSGYNLFTEETIEPAVLAARVHREKGLAIEGDGCLGLGGDVHYVTLPLSSWPDLVGRRVEVRFWQKPDGTRVTASFSWYAGVSDAEGGATYLGGVNFQPTGQVTSDGWEEWTSGPVDFAWAEVLAPSTLDFQDEAITAAYGGATPDDDARVYLDALSVQDLGPAAVAAQPCSLVDEATTCGAEGLCHLGRCVDAAIRAGQPILDEALRADYIDRRVFEVDAFEGGRAPQQKVELFAGALLPLKEHAVASTFWPTFSEAYNLLVDGHASSPFVSYPAFQNAGVCVHEGEADLLPGAPVVPLVFQAADDNAVALGLAPGDALVAIDGLPTAEWVAVAARLIGHPGDPAGRSVVTAPTIFAAALDAGAVVTFERCAAVPVEGGPCAAGDIETVELDLSALVGDALLAGIVGLGYGDIAECDYRFVRPVEGTAATPNTAYEFAGHADADGVRTLVINGVPSYYSQGGERWYNRVQAALSPAPELLILDERTGNGGGVDAMDWIAAGLLAPEDLYAMDFLPFTEADDLEAARAEVVACTEAQGDDCGNGFRWYVGDVAGDFAGAAASSKLAVLIASDVSGNDYVTKMLRRRSGETRVFGAGATWGAFGVIWSIAAHMGELLGGSLQVQDTIFVADPGDTNATFSTSSGERPDVVVRQKQSDCLRGHDTVLDAATAWLQGGAP